MSGQQIYVLSSLASSEYHMIEGILVKVTRYTIAFYRQVIVPA